MADNLTRMQYHEQVRKPQIEAAKASLVLTGDMRDMIAAALYQARPSFRIGIEHLTRAWADFEKTSAGVKVHHHEFADHLLIALDHLGLQIVARDS